VIYWRCNPSGIISTWNEDYWACSTKGLFLNVIKTFQRQVNELFVDGFILKGYVSSDRYYGADGAKWSAQPLATRASRSNETAQQAPKFRIISRISEAPFTGMRSNRFAMKYGSIGLDCAERLICIILGNELCYLLIVAALRFVDRIRAHLITWYSALCPYNWRYPESVLPFPSQQTISWNQALPKVS